MRVDAFSPGGEDTLPDAKALLRLLSYAFAEANQLGLADCAALIDQAANEVQCRMKLEPDVSERTAADHCKLH